MNKLKKNLLNPLPNLKAAKLSAVANNNNNGYRYGHEQKRIGVRCHKTQTSRDAIDELHASKREYLLGLKVRIKSNIIGIHYHWLYQALWNAMQDYSR